MDGSDLIKSFIVATGLPADFVKEEIERLAKAANKDVAAITIHDLRLLLVDYLQDVLIAAKDEYSTEAQ